MKHSFYGYLLGSTAALTFGAPAAAQANLPVQDPPAESGASEQGSAGPLRAEAEREILVTGSRVIRDGFQAPTPVSVVTEDEIQQAAPVTIADYVNQLPQLSGSTSPHTNNSRLSSPDVGSNTLNLRSLGTERTLTLLNGRRVTPSTITGTVDVNTLPTALVSRVDIVTGGASAAFGSDAVAGVVNFILDTKFEGIKGEVQGGITTHGDAENISGDLSYGTPFADGRGHVILSGSYSKQEDALFSDRDWFKAYKVIANPAFTPTNGEPRLLMNPWTSLTITDEGLIASGPLRGYAFDANGQLATTNFEFPPIISSIFGTGSEDAYRNLDDLSRRAPSVLPVEQATGYGRVSFDVSSDLTVFAEGSYGVSKATIPTLSYFRFGNTPIGVDNFYLPNAVRDAMAAAGVSTIPLSTTNAKLGQLTANTDRDALRFLGGVEGNLGANWSFDAFAQYGRAERNTRLRNNTATSNYARAVDAVSDPNNPGTPICRSTLTDPTNGCVPINPFGTVALSPQQIGYVQGTAATDVVYRQDVFALNIRGDVLTLPAGPVAVAFGGEYRRESGEGTADTLSLTNGWFAGNYKPFTGRYNVKEAYAEIAVPVFEDSPVGARLDLNAAGRITDYSTSGSVFTWKLGAVYQPIDDLTLRVTRSRDIRAPNLSDLFLEGSSSRVNIGDPFNNGANTALLQIVTGNPNLDPEKADTTIIGAVYRPSWLPGLALSLDMYDIKVNDAIASSGSQDIANRCAAGDQVFCSAIEFTNGVITQINVQPFNAQSEIARGLDAELSYRTSLGSGSLALRALATYVDKLEVRTGTGSVISRAGEVGNNRDQVGGTQGVPQVRGLASATYTLNPLTLQLKGRFIGASQVESDWGPLDINRNDVPAIFYLDAYAAYKIGRDERFEVFVASENLLDKDPPPSQNQDSANVLAGGVSVAIYDVLGRMVRAGVRFKF